MALLNGYSMFFIIGGKWNCDKIPPPPPKKKQLFFLGKGYLFSQFHLLPGMKNTVPPKKDVFLSTIRINLDQVAFQALSIECQ
jgi:hypothetical protein